MIKRIIRKIYSPIINRIDRAQRQLDINRQLVRCIAGSACRVINQTIPASWEFSGFSQNGEDGIIDFLTRKIINPNNYFIEVGASDGIENNSAWLAYVRKYSGIMIDGNQTQIDIAKSIQHSFGTEYLNLFVSQTNVISLSNSALYKNPDLFSLDIDGNDYYIVKAIFEGGFLPKIFVVEYNSAYGPDKSITIQYNSNFIMDVENPNNYLYYGVSLNGWKKLFATYNYQFITTDSNGVNAFFVNPNEFNSNFLSNIKVVGFRENFFQFKEYRSNWEKQFELIKNKSFLEIE